MKFPAPRKLRFLGKKKFIAENISANQETSPTHFHPMRRFKTNFFKSHDKMACSPETPYFESLAGQINKENRINYFFNLSRNPTTASSFEAGSLPSLTLLMTVEYLVISF